MNAHTVSTSSLNQHLADKKLSKIARKHVNSPLRGGFNDEESAQF